MTNTAKPSWDDSPGWANYLAQDKSGMWWWHKSKPTIEHDMGWTSVLFEHARVNENWKDTLEKRPSPVTSIWDLLPQNVKYIAMDEDEAWYGYEEKPMLTDDDTWVVDSDDWYYAEKLKDLISVDGSLIQRPD